MARPTVLDSAKRQVIVDLVAAGASRNVAARAVGCAASTISYQSLRDRPFGTRLRRAAARRQLRIARLLARGPTGEPPACSAPPGCGVEESPSPPQATRHGDGRAPCEARSAGEGESRQRCAFGKQADYDARHGPQANDASARQSMQRRARDRLASEIADDFEDALFDPGLITDSLCRLTIGGVPSHRKSRPADANRTRPP